MTAAAPTTAFAAGPVPPGPDFVVLTGFLGSGKTTLLRDALGRPEAADTAVIVNEAGAIDLDGAILREAGEVALALMPNGCVCCQGGGDLAATVEALLAAERPGATGPLRRIVLETSGLAKPGPVLRQVASLARHRMRAFVLATYDAERGPASAPFEEAAAQWAGAHRIVVTKADRVGPDRLARAAAEAAGLNPLAEIVATHDRAAAVMAALAPPSRPLAPASPPGPSAAPHPRIGVFLARPRRRLAFDDLASWLDNVAGALGERLLRLKGLVPVEAQERPLLVQSVGTLFSEPRPFAAGAAAGAFIVVIARDTRADEIAAIAPADAFLVSAAPAPVGPEGISLGRRPVPRVTAAEASCKS